MKRVAINGYGRIGRCVLRALVERQAVQNSDTTLEIVAINEPADLATIAYLTQYDSTHGRFPVAVDCTDKALLINGRQIAISHEESLTALDWQGIDLVLECSGVYNSRASAEKHIAAGAGKVLFSQPADPEVDITVVKGVNDQDLRPEHRIVSNASCTTNCIVPVIATLNATRPILAGQITTLHSMMNDQPVIDAYHHTDLRKTRSASESLIPIDTALAKGIERILPALVGRFSANAVRVPTTNVSAMDMSLWFENKVSVESINELLLKASADKLKGVLGFSDEPLVSCDFNHDPRSGIVDAAQTSVSGEHLAKIFTWFDNEWGFANRMLDVAVLMLAD